MNGAWADCQDLEVLDVSDWDTTIWEVTNMGSAFIKCYSLKVLDLSSWNTENWTITNFQSTFSAMFKIKRMNLSCFAGRQFPVTLVSSIFSNNCIPEIDLTGWDYSQWNITNVNYGFANSTPYLKRLKGTATLGAGVTNNHMVNSGGFNNLEDFDGFALEIDHSYANFYKLSHQSLVNILTALPIVAESRKITLGQSNQNRLTPEEIAIATQKGWTVA